MNNEEIKEMDLQTLIDTASKTTFQIQSLAGVLETDICGDEQETINAWWEKTGCNVVSHLARLIQGLIEDQRQSLNYIDKIRNDQINSGWVFTEEAKEIFSDLQRIVEMANNAAEEQKTRYLISALRDVAAELEQNEVSKEARDE